MAKELGLDEDELRARLLAMSNALPDYTVDVLANARADGLVHPTLERLASDIRARAKICHDALAAPRRDARTR